MFWWGGHFCPMHCDPFKIYCAPPNLGITRRWIRRLNFAQRPFFQAWGSLTSLKSQTRDPSFKSLPEDLCSGFLRPEKSIDLSRIKKKIMQLWHATVLNIEDFPLWNWTLIVGRRCKVMTKTRIVHKLLLVLEVHWSKIASSIIRPQLKVHSYG